MKKRWPALAVACLVAVIFVLPSTASAARTPLFAAMSGANEIADDGTKGVGDPDGGGSFSAVIRRGQMCYGLAVRNIQDPVMAHIHRGGKNKNGPIVIPLDPPSNGDPGASSGCVTVERALIRAIRRRPGKFYVNVHTGDYPAGAIRGQLFTRGA